MSGTLAPLAVYQPLDDNGNIVPSGQLFTYAAGTTTPATTYSDVDLAPGHANSNPIILDSAGRCVIYLPPSAFKFVFETSVASGSTVIWTQDNIGSVPPTAVSLDVPAVAGEALTAGDAVYLSTGTGGDPGTAGHWYKTDADNVYSSTGASTVGMVVADIASGDTGTVRLQGQVTGLSSLSVGTVYYISAVAGAITSSAPANARAMGQADSATSIVLSGALSPPFATASIAGLVSTTTQTFAGDKTFNGVVTFGVAPLGTVRWARCTATVTKNNSTAFADVTGMAIAIAANEALIIEAFVHITSGVTPGIKFQFTGPAAATAVDVGIESQGFPNQNIATAFSAAFNTAGLAVGNPQSLHIRGLIRNGANAGTIQLQFAQNTADVSDTKVYVESVIYAIRVA